RAVGPLRRRAGGMDAVGLDGLELRELLERRLAQTFVARHGPHFARRLALVVERGRVDGHDLAREAPFLPGIDGVLLAAQPVAIRVLARDAILLRDHLRALELRCEGVMVAIAPRQG